MHRCIDSQLVSQKVCAGTTKAWPCVLRRARAWVLTCSFLPQVREADARGCLVPAGRIIQGRSTFGGAEGGSGCGDGEEWSASRLFADRRPDM